MVEYKVDLETLPVVRQLRHIGADMQEINGKILTLIGHAGVTQSNAKYLRDRSPISLGRVTGNLAGSISVKRNEWTIWDENPGSLTIGTNIPYAPRWEFGGRTKKGTKLHPKPFLKPSLDDVFGSGKAQRIAENELQKQINARSK